MDLEKITYLGATDARGKKQAFGIKAKDRSKHMYIIGKTGMGKSTLLENMAIQDIQHGNGLGFIDPHGSTAEKLLDYVPEHRMEDVIYFAPFDLDHPIAFNVMEDVGYDKRHLVVSGLMSTFKKIWVDAWSARMEYILTNVLLALLEFPDSTLLDVNKMLVNKSFRKKVVDNITDPVVKDFWEGEFANYSDRYTQEATPAIQNKIGQFTSNPLIRNIIGQPKSSFDLREVMDKKKIFIANLSKGRMGETNASLLGSMLTTKIYLSAMSRADEPAPVQAKLPPFYFYVDEFQSIANESFADILSEARKYKLALIIAHQYVEQMEENVRNAVFGNVGTTIAFRVGPFDAEVLETIFQPKFMAEDLVSLGFAQIYLTLMIDGVGSPPFSATTLPPINEPEVTFRDKIIDMSRVSFGRKRAEVEASIWERNKSEEPASASSSQKKSAPTNAARPQSAPSRPSSPRTETVRPSAPRTEETRPVGAQARPSDAGARPVSAPQTSTPVDSRPPRKEKQTISLGALKVRQHGDDKGPSPEQRSALRDALLSIQKTKKAPLSDKPQPEVSPKRETVPEKPAPKKPVEMKENPRPEQSPKKEAPQDVQKETPQGAAKEVPKDVLENIFKDNT